jgi:hypothetical protein
MADEVIRNDAGLPTGVTGVTDIIKRISWGAVWAGVVAALGMEILLTLFGFFIGFRMYHGDAANPWRGLAAWSTVWYLVTAGWSMFFGAWCAARLSGNPVTGDGILHGISTWGMATTATVATMAIALWAILREGINVLATAALVTRQVAPETVPHIPPGELPRALGNAGPMAQATASLISDLSFVVFWGVLIGFVTAIIGGWLGRKRTVIVTPRGVVPIPTPTRRAA